MWQGVCMAGSVCGRGGMHGGGMCGRAVCAGGGACMVGGMHGRGVCVAGGHVWQRGGALCRYYEMWSMSRQYTSY